MIRIKRQRVCDSLVLRNSEESSSEWSTSRSYYVVRNKYLLGSALEFLLVERRARRNAVASAYSTMSKARQISLSNNRKLLETFLPCPMSLQARCFINPLGLCEGCKIADSKQSDDTVKGSCLAQLAVSDSSGPDLDVELVHAS